MTGSILRLFEYNSALSFRQGRGWFSFFSIKKKGIQKHFNLGVLRSMIKLIRYYILSISCSSSRFSTSTKDHVTSNSSQIGFGKKQSPLNKTPTL